MRELKKGYQVVGGSHLPVSRYCDDEVGLARETSHPNFRSIASDDFYYDVTDDFSPFGNDDGSDTLMSLQDWYQSGGSDAKVMRFLKEFLDEWDLGVPKKLHLADPKTIERWLGKSEMNETYLLSECRARLATAFGQLKITGTSSADCRADGLAAIECMLWLNERAALKHPNWQHATAERTRLLAMQGDLVRFVVLGGLTAG